MKTLGFKKGIFTRLFKPNTTGKERKAKLERKNLKSTSSSAGGYDCDNKEISPSVSIPIKKDNPYPHMVEQPKTCPL